MCLIFVAYNTNSQHRYVVAANRDEFRSRNTAPLGFLGNSKNVLGGMDLQAGGMWLGVTRSGKFAAITNYRDSGGREAHLPSRGNIVSQYLHCNDSALCAIGRLAEDCQKYAGFNVFFGDDKNLVYFSNRKETLQILKPGFYGLSNHLLDTPWPKVTRGKDLLRSHMCETDAIDTAEITRLLRDTTVPDATSLPDTGVGPKWERFLSPIFIDGNEYGTRSTAVVEIGKSGKIDFTETSYLKDKEESNASPKRMGFKVDI